MDVRLPDGTVIANVPEGTTKAALVSKLQANGMQVPPAWLSGAPLGSQTPVPGEGYPTPPPGPMSAVDHLKALASNLAGGAVDTAGMLGTGMIAKPAGDIAGLGAIAGNALGMTDRDPAEVQSSVQGALQGQPNSDTGALVQKGLGAAGGALAGAGKAIGGGYTNALDSLGLPSSVSEGVGNGVAEATNQLPTLLGTKLPAAGKARIAQAADDAVAAAPKQEAIQAAKDNGYSLLPSDTISAPAGKLAAGIAGKNDMNAVATIKNQVNTNNLGKADVGIPADQPLSARNIEKRDAVADAGYQAVKTADQNIVLVRDADGNIVKNAAGKPIARPAGPMQPDPVYAKEIAQIGDDRAGSQLAPNPQVIALRDQLTGAQGALKPADAINDLNRIRTQARANLKATDKPGQLELGQAQMQAADAMEARLERYLQSTGQTNLYNQFTAARTLKAKLYTIKDNYNSQTGNIDAAGVAAEREKTGGMKSPMSGGLKAIADAADALPNTVKNSDRVQAPAPVSALSFLGGAAGLAGGAAAHGTLGGAGMGLGGYAALMSARPALRSGLMSDLYQRTLGAQTPAASALSRLAAQPASPLAGLAAVGQEPQQ